MSGGTGTGNEQLYSVDRARSAGQAEHMEAAAQAGKCVFCDINHTKNKILAKDGSHDPTGSAWKRWHVWMNPFPQEHQQHIMIVPKRHFSGTAIWNIRIAEWAELLLVLLWAVKFFGLRGGGVVFRFGDTAFNAGSIPGHFHVQIQAPDGTGPVQATLFKDFHPAEQVRRKTEKAYTKDQFEGWMIFGKDSKVLCFKDNKYLRWGKPNKPDDKVIFPASALGDIYLALKGWNEQIDLVQRATWTKGDTLPSEGELCKLRRISGSSMWEVFAFAAYKITEEALAKYGEVEGYAYMTPSGNYLDRKLDTANEPHYFHWHAARYVEEALWLRDQIKYEPAASVYWRPGTKLLPANCDALNWIDDKEDFDQLGIW